MIADDLEIIFSNRDATDEPEVEETLAAVDRLKNNFSPDNLPELVAAIQSPKNNFWTRELLSSPLCEIGGAEQLEVLLEAAQKGLDEGHDNDSFHSNLIDLVERKPQECRTKLEGLKRIDNYIHAEAVDWLLEYC